MNYLNTTQVGAPFAPKNRQDPGRRSLIPNRLPKIGVSRMSLVSIVGDAFRLCHLTFFLLEWIKCEFLVKARGFSP